MSTLLKAVLISIFLSSCVNQVTSEISVRDGTLSYWDRLPQENDNVGRHADVFLHKSPAFPIFTAIAHHWGLLFRFNNEWILIEGIHQGNKLLSKYSKMKAIPAEGNIYELTKENMTKNHDFFEIIFGWLLQNRRSQLGDFPNGVTVSPAQLRDIAAKNPFDNVEYELQVTDCHTWAIASTQALEKYKN